MNLHFYKYQATGNDFILISTIEQPFDEKNSAYISFLCDRHFGIGADGLLILKKNPLYDFEMNYFNSDGFPSTMCGNGGRCITAFARHLNIIQQKCIFLAPDGIHTATIINDSTVALNMKEVNQIIQHYDGVEINTGSPHFIVEYAKDIDQLDVFNHGKNIRNLERFKPNGINVNFINRLNENTIKVRTYERGVETETLSCGTGSVASAIYTTLNKSDNDYLINILTRGGPLTVSFTKKNQTYTNIWLTGEAKFVFEGYINY